MTRKYILFCLCLSLYTAGTSLQIHIILALNFEELLQHLDTCCCSRRGAGGEWDMFLLCVELRDRGTVWFLLSSHFTQGYFSAFELPWQIRPRTIISAWEQLGIASYGSKWGTRLVKYQLTACFLACVPPRFGSLASVGPQEHLCDCPWQQHFSLLAGMPSFLPWKTC